MQRGRRRELRRRRVGRKNCRVWQGVRRLEMEKEVGVDGGHGSMRRRDCRAFDCTF